MSARAGAVTLKPVTQRGLAIDWEPCRDVSEVRTFLTALGFVKRLIPNYEALARPLVLLACRKMKVGEVFEFGAELVEAQQKLKSALSHSVPLRPVTDKSKAPTTIRVKGDASLLTVGGGPISIATAVASLS
ncbi:hypothetical protein FB45DRAFT_1029426 [Roridomyces roridus]|uniref:Uncharacterized protein n=1 Tax=Roridomyces roridus TaxID=1738132 RepID=A0AAD7FJA7_9AGAR|nr:hypothetical protein FB45DRAFT_1029426 [Roridomyces roridus]